MSENKTNRDKFKIQDKQYNFPYHYLPHFDEKGAVQRYRVLTWGLEYLCYLKHVEEMVKKIQPSSVLEVGCGDGRLTGILAEHYPKVLGVDISEKAILLAQGIHGKNTFQNIDAANLEENFDVVIAMEVLEHIPDEYVSSFLKTLSDRTNDGGSVIITVPSKILPLHPKHYRHYDIELFQQQLNEANTELEITTFEHIYKKSFGTKLYQKISNNRFFYFECHFWRRWIWKNTWKKNRFAKANTGHHLVVHLKK